MVTNTSPNGTQGGTFLNVLTSPLPGNYFAAVVNLNPIAYWPLNETAPAPSWPAVATNSGSLGSAADAVYSGQVLYQNGSALADGEGNSILGDGLTDEVVLPYTSAVATSTLTVEGWFNPTSGFNNGGETLVSDGFPGDGGQPVSTPSTGFWINAGFHRNTGDNTGDFELLIYQGTKSAGVDIDVTNFAPNVWYHVAATIAPNPGSNAPDNGYISTLYIDGTNAGSGISGFVPNTGGAFKAGDRSDDPGFGSFNFAGGIANVAYYPTALSAAKIAAHYAAGTNASPVTPYQTVVINDGPTLFFLLDEAQPTFPSDDTGPAAVNYGALGANDNGVYLTGTFPGSVPGPGVEQFPGSDVAVAINHIYWQPGGPTTAGTFNNETGIGNTGFTGFVDVPVDSFNSLNFLGPVSMAVWVQASTPDPRNAFTTFTGRGDPSYRMDVDTTSDDQLHFAYGGAGDQVGTGLPGIIDDGVWHFVVGVWDGTNQFLYIDGVSNSSSAAAGLPVGDDYDYVIGEAPDDTGRVFDGNLAELAIFAHALTGAQVASLYTTAQVAAEIVDEPIASQIIGASLNASITVVAVGNSTLAYQWYHNGAPVSGSEYSGANTATLDITGALISDSGTYYVVVSNSYGLAVTSSPSLMTVLAQPIVTPDFPATNYALAGNTVSLQVTTTSAGQYTNAWFFNGVLVVNGNGIGGATTTTLNILNVESANVGTYTYWATNAFGTGTASTVLIVLPFSEPTFNTNGTDWTVNNNNITGGQGTVTNNVLQLTDHGGGETTSFFFNVAMYVGAFKASWIYTDVGSDDVQNDTADGFTFCLANNAKGPGALGTENGGAGGSGLAYVGITNSFALATELYDNGDNAPGISPATNGLGSKGAGNATGYNYGPVLPVDIISGDGIKYDLVYDGQSLAVTLTDTNTGATFSTNYSDINIPQDLGGVTTALIGFTGATGGVTAIQTIANFTYTPLPLLSATLSAGSTTLTWPTGMGLGPFSLQTATSLSGPWTAVTATVNVVGGSYVVTLPTGTGNVFYRLVAN